MSGTSVLPYRYRINGVLSTDKTVMQNMEMITSAAQSWLTYDINLGKWAVVINEPGSSTVSFDDSNIVGPISVQGTGLRELYNTVRVEFPHVDLADEPDYIEDTIPAGDRNANEPDNTLTINLDLINDPVMAESLGIVELKQSRVNRVIRFTTDYTHLGVKAGDLIDVTNSVLGYTNKVFRVVSMAEEDAEDGGLNITITALEYDANVYDLSDIFRYERSNQNGLVTIGYVGAPTTPTITAFANSARPRTSIATTVPTGIVDGIEFWFSNDGTNYVLLSTETPTGGAFTYGQAVTYDYDKYVVTSNVYAKCRAVNATTTSDYSNVGSLLNFAPVQITDAIGANTSVRDNAGATISLAALLPTLINALSGLYGGNISSGSPGGNIASAMSGQGFMVSVNAGQTTVANIAQAASNTSPFTTLASSTFSPNYNGVYKFDVLFNQLTSGGYGGRGVTPFVTEPEDLVQVRATVYNITGGGNTYITSEDSGGVGTFYWTDYALQGKVTLNVGQIYKIEFKALFYTESVPGYAANITFGWNVYSTI